MPANYLRSASNFVEVGTPAPPFSARTPGTYPRFVSYRNLCWPGRTKRPPNKKNKAIPGNPIFPSARAQKMHAFFIPCLEFCRGWYGPSFRSECPVPLGLGIGNSSNPHCVCFWCTDHKLSNRKSTEMPVVRTFPKTWNLTSLMTYARMPD